MNKRPVIQLTTLLGMVVLILLTIQPVMAADVTFNIGAGLVAVLEDNQCSLQEAFTNINNQAQTYDDCPAPTTTDANIVEMAGGTYNLGSELFAAIHVDLTINGNGAVLNGGGVTRLMRIENYSSQLFINNLTFQNGYIDSVVTPFGGALRLLHVQSGATIINDSRFIDNVANNDDSDLAPVSPSGGAIYVDTGTLEINNSYFENNAVTSINPGLSLLGGAIGSDIEATGDISLIINASTFYGNAGRDGSAIYANTVADLFVLHSTFYLNEGPTLTIFHPMAQVFNSTFVNNTDTDIVSSQYALIWGNLFYKTTGSGCLNSVPFGTYSLGHNIDNTGTCLERDTDILYSGDGSNLISMTLDSSGPSGVPVLPLVVGSIAIDTGTSDPIEFVSDQAGNPRVRGAGQDIGAVEYYSNTAAVITNDAKTVYEGDGVVNFPGVLDNDSDPDGDSLAIVAVGGTPIGVAALVDAKTVSYNPNGQFETLAAGETTTDSFTYTVSDGVATSNGTVTVTIQGENDAPVAAADTGIVSEDAGATAVAVLVNDDDPDTTDTLSIIGLNTLPDGLVTFTANSLSYSPNGQFESLDTGESVTDTFSYIVSDGISGSEASVTVTINGVNDAPVAADDLYSTSDGNILTVNAANGVLKNDTDVEGDSLTAVIVSNPTNGAVSLNNDGSFSYTPTEGFGGVDSFTYKANDGTADSSVVTVRIAVGDVQIVVVTPEPTDPGSTPTPTPTDTPISGPPEAPQNIRIEPNQGRPTIIWDYDGIAQWFNVWFGGAYGAHFQWYLVNGLTPYEPDQNPLQCAGLTCTLTPNINFPAGDYQIWMQGWRNGEASTGGTTPYDGWSSAQLTIENTPPGPITPLTGTVSAEGDVTLRWQGAENATWYNIWFGDSDFVSVYYNWVLAEDLGCANAGLCTLMLNSEVELPAALPAGDYLWYVRSWGPGGFSTGGIPGAEEWVQGPDITVP